MKLIKQVFQKCYKVQYYYVITKRKCWGTKQRHWIPVFTGMTEIRRYYYEISNRQTGESNSREI